MCYFFIYFDIIKMIGWEAGVAWFGSFRKGVHAEAGNAAVEENTVIYYHLCNCAIWRIFRCVEGTGFENRGRRRATSFWRKEMKGIDWTRNFAQEKGDLPLRSFFTASESTSSGEQERSRVSLRHFNVLDGGDASQYSTHSLRLPR